MRRILVLIVLAVVALSDASGQSKNQPAPNAASSALAAEAREAINKGNAQWIEGWKKSDAALVASIFADDGVQLAGSGKIIKGREEIRARQKAAMDGADPGVKVTVTTLNVWVDGNTAYETGKYKYEYTEKGKPSTDEGRYVTVWKRQQDGSWKLSMDMGVPNN